MKPQMWLLAFNLFILIFLSSSFEAAIALQREGTDGKSRAQQTQLSPQQLFKRVSRSVFVVEALDQSDSVIAFGSGVALAPNLIVSNKHVIQNAIGLRVRQGDVFWKAEIDQIDKSNDLCLLLVPGLGTAAVTLRPSSTLAVGERVYAIGAPEGLELTFSEGLISGLRRTKTGTHLIQTTTPLSHGSSGGGLFDVQGKLVGITTFSLDEGQQLNFALSSDLLLTLKRNFDQWMQGFLLGYKADQIEEEAFKAKGMGDQKRAAKAYDAALKLRLEVLRLNPTNDRAWRQLGGAYEKLGKYDQALKAYEQEARLLPDEGSPHISSGDVLQKIGDSKGALNEYHLALQLKIEAFDYYCIGVSLAEMGELHEATIILLGLTQRCLEGRLLIEK